MTPPGVSSLRPFDADENSSGRHTGWDRTWAANLIRGGRLVARLPAWALIGLIKIYQHTLAPALPVLTMGRCGCRFSPTCSHYAVEAIRTRGLVAGGALAALRLLKCTPLHPGGFDPVPPPRRPHCARATSA